MDGGRRLLQSLDEERSPQGAFAPTDGASQPPPRRARSRARPSRWGRVAEVVSHRGFGSALIVVFALAVADFSFRHGGGYERFVAEHGAFRDVLARTAGFGVDAITITGQRDLLSADVLALSGVRPHHSLPFLDPQGIRAALMASPMVQSASVRRLFPNQLVIAIEERQAHAVWQRDGEVWIIGEDGEPIDRMRDQRFARLPFVVGEGANKRFREYKAILEQAGPLQQKIRAGVLVGQRRWTLKFESGLELRLPDREPEQAMARFVALDRRHAILEKDLLAIDMRAPGRVVALLSAEAAARRDAGSGQRRRNGGPA